MKHQTWLNVAHCIAEDSKCVSMKVGTVLVKNGHQISTGINGTPKGYTNCNDRFVGRCDEHHKWSLKYEIHSELSSLIYCPVSAYGSIAYVTHSPCFNCLKHLVAAGIKAIFFVEKYHRMTTEEWKEIINFCIDTHVGLVHAQKDNWVVYYQTGAFRI
ncbi:deoxycytidylate deaminase [Paraglaciecola Antarctic GD virus 1]|nr:deoxycytidylate deaminase [Paraglaciecola Antarctic GD virus 1]